MNDDHWQQLKEYQEQQRLARIEQAQKRAEEKQRREQQTLEEIKDLEQKRRESIQCQPVDLVNLQVKKIIEEDSIAALAKDLQAANQQRDLALRVAHKRMEAMRTHRPDVPYDTFAEQYFHERWKQTYPEIELIPQYHIGPYRVDFCHMHSKTVIELNGSIHRLRRVQNRDAPRHRYLESIGWHVLVFMNDEVTYGLDACVGETFAVITERQGR